ncbi:MAG: SemiSWEET transporter [Proteobacteria bacterium]|nr:SemiSWEET transporter [Pseudomonadota bacterium]
MSWITILGLVAAACTTVSFLPQAIKIIKTKETGGISLLMYLFLECGLFLWLIYGILIESFPLMLANGIALLLSSLILILKLKYSK